MELRHIYRSSIYVSPRGSVVGLPILSDNPVSNLIEHLYIQEPLDIMTESKIVTQA